MLICTLCVYIYIYVNEFLLTILVGLMDPFETNIQLYTDGFLHSGFFLLVVDLQPPCTFLYFRHSGGKKGNWCLKLARVPQSDSWLCLVGFLPLNQSIFLVLFPLSLYFCLSFFDGKCVVHKTIHIWLKRGGQLSGQTGDQNMSQHWILTPDDFTHHHLTWTNFEKPSKRRIRKAEQLSTEWYERIALKCCALDPSVTLFQLPDASLRV